MSILLLAGLNRHFYNRIVDQQYQQDQLERRTVREDYYTIGGGGEMRSKNGVATLAEKSPYRKFYDLLIRCVVL